MASTEWRSTRCDGLHGEKGWCGGQARRWGNGSSVREMQLHVCVRERGEERRGGENNEKNSEMTSGSLCQSESTSEIYKELF
jgi:hypothetical protein